MLCRTRKNLGLQLTAGADYYNAMQIVKTQLLLGSADETVRNMISAKIAREASMSRLLKPSKINTEAVTQVKLNLLFPTQPDRQDWGMEISKPNTRPLTSESLCPPLSAALQKKSEYNMLKNLRCKVA